MIKTFRRYLWCLETRYYCSLLSTINLKVFVIIKLWIKFIADSGVFNLSAVQIEWREKEALTQKLAVH